MNKVEKTKKKIILPPDLLLKLLTSLDAYIANFEDIFKKIEVREPIYFEMLIVRLFIKLSLILPLRTSQMLTATLSNIQNSTNRSLTYNGVNVKIPNNLRKEIFHTLDYALRRYNKTYNTNHGLFVFLYSCLNMDAKPSVINLTLPKIYKELNIPELLEQKFGGKKRTYIYPAECYKMTAISNMLESGVNILYLAQLTGLDIRTLVAPFDIHNKIIPFDNVSIDINKSLITCDYYEYL